MKCSVGGELAFDAKDVFCGGMDGIHRTPKNGGADTLVLSNNRGPFSIVLDGDRIYFMDFEIATGEAMVHFVAKTGGAATDVCKVETPEEERPYVFAVDSTSVFIGTLGHGNFKDEVIDTAEPDYKGGVILSVPKNGGAITILANEVHSVSGIVVDDANVYWSEHGTYLRSNDYKNDGAIKSVPKSGGAVTTIATSLDSPGKLVRTGDELRFSTGGHFVKAGGTFSAIEGPMTIPKTGGKPAPATTACFLGETTCYGTRSEYLGVGFSGKRTKTTIEGWPKSGGKHQAVYSTERDVLRLAYDDGSLWWLEGTDYQLKRLKK